MIFLVYGSKKDGQRAFLRWIRYPSGVSQYTQGTVAAATVLPKFLKFWTPPHDLALLLIVGSFEPFGHALMLDDFKGLTLGLFFGG